MADFVFNQSMGRLRTFADNASGDVAASALTLWLLKASVGDDTARDYDDLAALLGDVSTDEADFTNYARKDISGGDVTVTVDDTNNRVDVDIPDQTWTSAGNGTNNTLTDFDAGYDADTGAGTDGDITPISQHDLSVTTDGSDLTIQIDSAGLLRAA